MAAFNDFQLKRRIAFLQILHPLNAQIIIQFRKFQAFFMQFEVLLYQLNEHRHLGLQYLRNNRCKEKVNCPQFIALVKAADVVGGIGGNKNDGYVRSAAIGSHDLHRFETIHFRHIHIQQNNCEIVLQHLAQCFFTGGGSDNLVGAAVRRAIEHSLQHQQTRRVVVYQQDLGLTHLWAQAARKRIDV